MAEAQAKEKAGELISRELVARQAQYIFICLRQAILNFPTKYAHRIIGLPSEHEGRQVLTKAAHEFLTELADFPEKAINPDWLRPRSRWPGEGASSPVERPGDQGRAEEGEDSSPEKDSENFAPKAEVIGIIPIVDHVLARLNLRPLFLAQQAPAF